MILKTKDLIVFADLETQLPERSNISIDSIKSFEPSSFLESIATMSPTVIDGEVDDNGLECECGVDVSLSILILYYSSDILLVNRLRVMLSFVKVVARNGSTFG